MLRTKTAEEHNRRLLGSVIESIITYAAPAWKEGCKTAKHANRLLGAHRKVGLGIARAYRTVSTEASREEDPRHLAD